MFGGLRVFGGKEDRKENGEEEKRRAHENGLHCM
jgi:hypothetical protein